MRIKRLRTDQKITRLSIAILLFVILIISYFLNPEDYSLSTCMLNETTGYSCPTCGLTRSFHATANLKLIEATSYHLLGPLLFLISLLLIPVLLIESIMGKSIPLRYGSGTVKFTIIIIGILWIIYWIARLIIEI